MTDQVTVTADDNTEAAELLEQLLQGKDRLLTAAEVCEILNINANTLYLWRASGEVNLPFQRFLAPGQTRGLIRYRYSDVVQYLAEGTVRGDKELTHAREVNSRKRTPAPHEPSPEEHTIEVDAETLRKFERLQINRDDADAPKKAEARRKSKKKKDAMRDLPMAKLMKYEPVFVEEEPIAGVVRKTELVEEPEPQPEAQPEPEVTTEPIPTTPKEAEDLFAKAAEIAEQFRAMFGTNPPASADKEHQS
jgi:hypothetical protein